MFDDKITRQSKQSYIMNPAPCIMDRDQTTAPFSLMTFCFMIVKGLKLDFEEGT